MTERERSIRIQPPIDESFESCLYCVHSEDSEEVCVLRKCVHAIQTLKECYKPVGVEENKDAISD